MTETKTTRRERGEKLYRTGKVTFIDGDLEGFSEFEVEGSGGKKYLVAIDAAYGEAYCRCEDARRNPNPCKHEIAAEMLRREMLDER